MLLGIDYGFWLGMGVVAGITLIGCLVAWLLPPKAREAKPEQHK